MPAPRIDESAVRAFARGQDDVVTRAQARALGFSKEAIQRRVGPDGWRAPTRGVLIIPPVTDPVRSLARAVQLSYDGAICGITAARLHRMRGLPARHDDEPCHLVTTADGRRSPVVRRHRHRLDADDVQDLAGIPLTTPARTLRDLVPVLDEITAVCVLDAAIHDGLADPAVLAAVADERPGAAGRRRCLVALRQADGRSESPLETRARLLVIDAGLPPPQLQHPADDGVRVLADLDLAWPATRLAVELDGTAVHAEPAALHRDRERRNDLVDLGWRVLRFTWQDVVRRPVHVSSTIRRAMSTTAVTLADASAG